MFIPNDIDVIYVQRQLVKPRIDVANLHVIMIVVMIVMTSVKKKYF